MKQIVNQEQWQQVGETRKLEADAYVCVITSVEDVSDKEYLRIEFDIHEGPFKGYFGELFKSKQRWYGSFIKSYKEKALSYFKSFITAVEKSNSNYVWNWDEKTLLNKLLVINFADEQYQGIDGELYWSVKPQEFRSIEALKNGKVKKLDPIYVEIEESYTEKVTPIAQESDLPF